MHPAAAFSAINPGSTASGSACPQRR